MENRSHALMTGFFTIALLVGTVLAGIWFNRDRVERVPYEIATIQSVPGLNPQAAVRYRGLEVGKVDDITFDPIKTGQILIRLSVDEAAPITTTTYATLGYQGVTGIAYVHLDDEKTGSPLLMSTPGKVARLPLRPGFLDQLETRGMVILEKTEQIVTRIDELLSPANQKLMVGTLEDVSSAAKAFAALPAKLDPTLKRLPGLADQFQESVASFDQFSDDAAKMSRNFDQLATDLQSPDGPIARLNTTIDRVGSSLEAVSTEIELQTLPNVHAAATEARTSLRAVRRAMNTLNERPQSLLFGARDKAPGPGEEGFVPPTK